MLILRPARPDDEKRLFEWRNDPMTRRFAFTTDEIDPATHSRWLRSKLKDPDTRLLIGEEDGTAVGQVRLERDGDAAMVHIAVAPAERGRGVGRRMLDATVADAGAALGVSTLRARVKYDNDPSLRAFRGAGFRDAAADGEVVELIRALG